MSPAAGDGALGAEPPCSTGRHSARRDQRREDAVTRKQSATPAGSSRSRLSPRLITALVLSVLALVFIFQNNQMTEIRVLIPVVIMPLWAALAGMLIVGAAIGYALNWHQR